MIIKKIGVILTSLIFLTSLSLIPAKADEIVSTEIDTYSPTLTEEEQKQIKGAKYLIEYLRQGGSIDLSNTSEGYTAIDLLDDIADFFNGTLAQFLGDEGYWINNISETQTPTYINLKEPKVSNEVNMMLGLLPFLNMEEETIIPNPEPNYQGYINIINGRRTQQPWNNEADFFWYDYIGDEENHPYYWIDGVASEYSYFLRTIRPTVSDYYANNTSKMISYHVSNSGYTRTMCACPITTINIFGSGNSYTFQTNISGTLQDIFVNDRFSEGIHCYSGTITSTNYFGNGTYNVGVDTTDNTSTYQEYSYTGTLEEIFMVLTMYCRNVNIYVNGEPWAIVGNPHYHIDLGQGTFVEGTNQPIQYDYPEPTKIDLTDLIDRLDLLIENQNKIKFPDFSDLIVDEDGQQAVAVVVVNKDLTVDDWYVTNYGTLIPLFPVFVDFPVDMTDITTIATVGIKDVIPSDILEIFGIALVGMLFVTWIHRLLE